MARILRSLRRFSNDGAINNAALEVDRPHVDLLIIEALINRVQSAGVSPEAQAQHAPNAA